MKIAKPWRPIEEDMANSFVRMDAEGMPSAAIMSEIISGFEYYYWCVFSPHSYTTGESNSFIEARNKADEVLAELGYKVISQKYGMML